MTFHLPDSATIRATALASIRERLGEYTCIDYAECRYSSSASDRALVGHRVRVHRDLAARRSMDERIAEGFVAAAYELSDDDLAELLG